MRPTKQYTVDELIKYRNKMLTRARSRTRVFQDETNNYYWTRLKEIDNALNTLKGSDFNTLGKIILK